MRSDDERVAALNRLLALQDGWWGAGLTLREFAVARAEGYAELRRKKGLAADFLDSEAAADDALLDLADPRIPIQGKTVAWLTGVIHNKIRGSVRREFHQLTAPSLDDPEANIEHPSTSHDERPQTRDSLADTWAFGRILVRALHAMPEERRRVARQVLKVLLSYHLRKQPPIGFREIANRLGKTEDGARKHWERARKDIEKAVRERIPRLLRLLEAIGIRRAS
jgi:DNA-directed RNA polymerase specialized sigma24 family protein